jgi:hypothetical protein
VPAQGGLAAGWHKIIVFDKYVAQMRISHYKLRACTPHSLLGAHGLLKIAKQNDQD